MRMRAGIIAALAIAAVFAGGDAAWADVASTLQTAGTNVITWVRAGAVLVVIMCGLAMVQGFRSAIIFVPALIGLAIALTPETIVGWVG